MIYTHKLIP